MPAPSPNVSNRCLGRSGTVSLHVNWTAQENDDLDGFVVLDPTRDTRKYLTSERFAVKRVRWSATADVETVLEFGAVGDGREILVIPAGATEGERDFATEPGGCRSDPDRESPSDIIVTTYGAQSYDRLQVDIDYKVKGTTRAAGVLS